MKYRNLYEDSLNEKFSNIDFIASLIYYVLYHKKKKKYRNTDASVF